jgi:hypothetical protein
LAVISNLQKRQVRIGNKNSLRECYTDGRGFKRGKPETAGEIS